MRAANPRPNNLEVRDIHRSVMERYPVLMEYLRQSEIADMDILELTEDMKIEVRD